METQLESPHPLASIRKALVAHQISLPFRLQIKEVEKQGFLKVIDFVEELEVGMNDSSLQTWIKFFSIDVIQVYRAVPGNSHVCLKAIATITQFLITSNIELKRTGVIDEDEESSSECHLDYESVAVNFQSILTAIFEGLQVYTAIDCVEKDGTRYSKDPSFVGRLFFEINLQILANREVFEVDSSLMIQVLLFTVELAKKDNRNRNSFGGCLKLPVILSELGFNSTSPEVALAALKLAHSLLPKAEWERDYYLKSLFPNETFYLDNYYLGDESKEWKKRFIEISKGDLEKGLTGLMDDWEKKKKSFGMDAVSVSRRSKLATVKAPLVRPSSSSSVAKGDFFVQDTIPSLNPVRPINDTYWPVFPETGIEEDEVIEYYDETQRIPSESGDNSHNSDSLIVYDGDILDSVGEGDFGDQSNLVDLQSIVTPSRVALGPITPSHVKKRKFDGRVSIDAGNKRAKLFDSLDSMLAEVTEKDGEQRTRFSTALDAHSTSRRRMESAIEFLASSTESTNAIFHSFLTDHINGLERMNEGLEKIKKNNEVNMAALKSLLN